VELGYTGSSKGMTIKQKAAVKMLLERLNPSAVHHGDCVGGDAEFDALCRGRFKRVLHPPSNPSKRAWCDAEEVLPTKPYLERNKDIAATDLLIAAPFGFREVLRSGEWATVRYARKAHTPRIIVYPDGTVQRETSRTQDH